MRRLLVLLVLVTMTGVSLHAQDEAKDTRSMTFYTEVNSGALTGDPTTVTNDDKTESKSYDRLFNGNCFVFGVTYDHRFANIPWMRLHARVNFVGTQSHVYETDLTSDKFGSWKGIDRSSYGYEVRGRGGLGFNFGRGSASISLDSRGLVYQSLDYSFSFGSAGTLGIGQELCMWGVPRNATINGEEEFAVLDMLGFNLIYNVSLGSGWSFRTRLRPQISSTGWEHLDSDDIASKFRIRWENRLSYRATPKVNIWGTVRYQVNNIISDTADVDHRVYLQGGVTYSFDVSEL